jgi:hypothetical protein
MRGFMMLRGLIIGIAVSLSATVFAGHRWSQSQPNRTDASYDTGYDPIEAIKKSLELLDLESKTESRAIEQILDELKKKSNRELLILKLASHLCQDIDCLGVSPDTARRYVEAFVESRLAEDTHQPALRNAAAAELSTRIAAASASVSFLSLLISVLSPTGLFSCKS